MCRYLLRYQVAWSLSTRDKLGWVLYLLPLYKGQVSLEWSLSTRDKLGWVLISYRVEPLYKGTRVGVGPLSLIGLVLCLEVVLFTIRDSTVSI